MNPPIRLLLAATVCYYSLCALDWAWSLHADPWRAEAFAVEQLQAKGVQLPQKHFREVGDHQYQATFADGSGRYAIVDVKKTEAGWQLVSLKQGTGKWIDNATASR
jgi:hypothetical protein